MKFGQTLFGWCYLCKVCANFEYVVLLYKKIVVLYFSSQGRSVGDKSEYMSSENDVTDAVLYIVNSFQSHATVLRAVCATIVRIIIK